MVKPGASVMTWLAMVLAVLLVCAGAAAAQDQAWVQIEAQPKEADAIERARAYTSVFPGVSGYALTSGWYGIVLGPFGAEEAAAKLRDLRGEGLIARDSFVTDGSPFRNRFWPAASENTGTLPAPDPAATASGAVTAPQPPALPDETPEQARASEATLTGAERQEVQVALQWFGLYTAAIDGAFGSGTRKAMAAWQDANGAVASGVLTSAQREALLAGYRSAIAGLGLQRITETESGIEIDLPLAMVGFDRYEPPFVRYSPAGGSGVTALLISAPGDETTLSGLSSLVQSLEIMPPVSDRRQDDRSFELSGRNDRTESYARAELSGGLIKGFALVWPVEQAAGMARVLDAMKASFRPIGGRALDPGAAPMTATARDGMLAGLNVQRPALSRSGFFIDAAGTVLTTTDILQSCSRLSIDGDLTMSVGLTDAAAGLAVLVPVRRLAPPDVAAFQGKTEAAGSEVAVAGYPYEDRLSAPTVTFGFVAAEAGLDGEQGVKRLSLPALPGDAGGPVVDATGAVVGMMLPRRADAVRQLPPDVAFAVSAPAIVARLQAGNIPARVSPARGALPPEDLARQARGMTVLVSCWK